MISSIPQLKEIAINFKIENKDSAHKVVTLETVIKVLSVIRKSFLNYAEYQLNNNELYVEHVQNKPQFKEHFLENIELLVVDANIGSFQSALAPNVIGEDTLFANETMMLREKTFIEYKSDVIYLDYYEQDEVNRVVSKYPQETRTGIYQPFLDAFSEDKKYSLILLDKFDKPVRKLIPVERSQRKKIIPDTKSRTPKVRERLVKGYFRIRAENDEIDIKKSNIKKVYDLEVLEHDTYPFKPDTIKYQNDVFILNKKLACEVEFQEDLYYIKNAELDISVWGDTREEVETAFSFTFLSLYKTFVEETDSNLSDRARKLKQKLQSLIKKHISG